MERYAVFFGDRSAATHAKYFFFAFEAAFLLVIRAVDACDSSYLHSYGLDLWNNVKRAVCEGRNHESSAGVEFAHSHCPDFRPSGVDFS